MLMQTFIKRAQAFSNRWKVKVELKSGHLHGAAMTKILIVEDNLEYAEEMAEFLTELEHEVHITSSAAAMWGALSNGNIGVVVLDLGLPDEDGFNVIPRMRQLYPQTGLLVLTGRV